jgi:catechol 2,3-dioxygenase-like lactoylglutathione lyase family enzyme
MRALIETFAFMIGGEMRTASDAKTMATTLRQELKAKSIDLSHAECLEITARQFGARDWNTFAAMTAKTAAPAGVAIERAIPIIRIFSVEKAREFYLDFLGCMVDWEHRFGENFPLYMQVSRTEFQLHLSEHHGDASPGSNAFVPMVGIEAFQRELIGKSYPYMKPGIEDLPWGRQVQVYDPFGNRIRFCERKEG